MNANGATNSSDESHVITGQAYLTVDGKRLEALWHGPSPDLAPTLVFLHEGLGCAKMWRDFPARLAEATGCGALVYSRLGYGRSDPCRLPRPIRFMHDEGLQVLPKVLAAAGIQECILVGHSDGGSIAVIYAGGTAAPQLKGLITEAAHVFCEELTLTSIRRAKAAYEQGDLRNRLTRFHGSNTRCAFFGWNDAWLHPDFVDWNLEEYLPAISVPMLVIQGEDDQYGTRRQVEAIARQAGAGARVLMLAECGHSPHRDQEDTVLEAMQAYIASVLE
jgi:pimeloyl-ACP methyl ester carboxylesterase